MQLRNICLHTRTIWHSYESLRHVVRTHKHTTGSAVWRNNQFGGPYTECFACHVLPLCIKQARACKCPTFNSRRSLNTPDNIKECLEGPRGICNSFQVNDEWRNMWTRASGMYGANATVLQITTPELVPHGFLISVNITIAVNSASSGFVLWYTEASNTFCFSSAGSRLLIFARRTVILNEGGGGTETQETVHRWTKYDCLQYNCIFKFSFLLHMQSL
jgi:hypothetical protein